MKKGFSFRTIKALFTTGLVIMHTLVFAQSITLPPESASITFTNPIVSSNMSLVIDGNTAAEAYTEVATVGGVQCRKIPSGKFMYISCTRAAIPTSQKNLLIAVTYYAGSNNNIWFNYNGTSNGYTGADFQKTKSNGWATAIVTITDGAFAGTMNGGADFRLGYSGEDNYIKEIKVYKAVLDPVSQAIPAKPNGPNSEFKNKSFAGYQIWHKAGPAAADWNHWSYGVVPAAGFHINEDIASFPDISQVPAAESYATNFAALGNGNQTRLYNAADASIINRQMAWCQAAGVDGVAIQRFVGGIGRSITVSPESALTNVKNACEATGRLFYICYDLNGTDATILQRMQTDWVYEIEQMRALTSSPNYATVNGKPVVEMWGVGYDMATSAQCAQLISFLQSRGCYVIGGTPNDWRTAPGAGFAPVFKSLNAVSPWTVGIYNTIAGANNYATNNLIPDKNYCTANGMDYLPVVFAGAANWVNGDNTLSQTNREGGKFFWQQVVNAKANGLTAIYMAMLDEFEESTNLINGAVDYFDIPTDQYFETFAKDGVWTSSDYYLRLAGRASKTLRGEIPVSNTIEVPYSNGPIYFRNSFESRATVIRTEGRAFSTTLKIDPCFFNPAVVSTTNITAPSVAIVNETSNTKTGLYSVKATGTPASATSSNYYYQVSETKIAVKANMQVSFWKYSVNALGQYTNVDLVFQSGKRLSALPAYLDNAGAAMSPTVARGTVGSWQKFTCQIGTGVLVGDVITGIIIGYDHPSASGSYTAYFDDIMVEDGTSVLVTGVSITPSSISLSVGSLQQLTATVAPANASNQNVTWSSSNTAIATVNASGMVTSVATGSATITATTQDGGKTSTSTITVTPATPLDKADNPIFRNIYTADPSAHVWGDGRLYVYPSHDIAPPRGCDLMDQYHVYSTADMVNWTDHGEILRASQVPWGRPEGGFMWAPDCAYKNGTYYYYYPHPSGTDWGNTWKIGIATSSSPAGGFTPQGYIEGLESMIDPCVFVDDDGQNYFYYGGGGVCKGGRLKDNMIEINGTMQVMTGLTDFHEATWVHKKNGLYYLSYSDNNAVGGNQLRYATSTNPLGPWTSKGVYIDPTGSATNHGSIVEFKGQSYAFYHNSDLSHNDWLRSVCVDKLNYNADGTIQKVIQTRGHGKPFGGTAHAIPGTIQMEDFDTGLLAAAYFDDNDTTNQGGQYRLTEGVDIETCSEGGYDIGFTSATEWMEYTVNAASAGTYTVNIRAASGNTGGQVQLRNTSGTVLATINVTGTGGWQTWSTFTTTVNLPAGIQILQVYLLTGGYNLNYIQFVKAASAPVISSAATAAGTTGQSFSYQITASDTPTGFGATGLPPGLTVNTTTGLITGTPTATGTYTTTVSATNASGPGTKAITITITAPAGSTPYLGTAWPIPGKVEVENYDVGGEGIAYHDVDAVNSGGQYRTTEGVDVETTGDTGGGYNVGFITTGEWMAYTVNVQTAGVYTLDLRLASDNAGTKTIHVEIDGVNVSGPISSTFVAGSGWQTYRTVSVTTTALTVGQKVMRIVIDAGDFNMNYVNFTQVLVPVISSAATAIGTTGVAFSYTITASNTPTSYAATGLPAGLTVNTTTGVISGTPTGTGASTVNLTATNAGGNGTKTLTITINPPAPVISSAATATGTTGVAFTYTIAASNTPTSYAATGLPAGLTVNTTTGVISGTPTGTGASTVNLTATNAGGNGTKTLTITINPPAPVISSAATATGTTGVAFSYTIAASNTPTSYAATGLPAGLSVNATTGVISGTPTGTGTSTVSLTATNAGGNGTKTLTITINPPVPVISSAATATGTTGVAFSYTIAASNTPTSFAATGLPAGLSVNATTGVISGTPTGTGTSTVSLTATNAGGNGTKTLTITISIAVPPSPVISSAATATGTTGVAFTYTITASNTPTSFAATGLPAGLTVNTTTGVISGTPTGTGASTVNLTATNAGGNGTKTLTITINPPSPVISSAATATGTTGVAFSYTITASNTPTSFAATGLPAGLTVNTTTGVISGTPTGTGASTVNLTATNAGGNGTKTLTITISIAVPPSPVISSAATATGTTGVAFTYTITASNDPTSFAATGLPAGLTLNTTTGVISGTPTGTGASTVNLTATNAGGNGTKTLTITINPPAPVISSAATATGTTGVAFTYTITASNTPTSYAATGLPAGLTVNATTGVISGTPTGTGTSAVNLTATNAGGNGMKTLTITISVAVPTSPSISSGGSATATIGSSFSYTITGSNSPTSFDATGLPAGLTVNTNTGVISGTPTASGTFTVTIKATNAGGTGSQTLTLTVNAAVPTSPSISSGGSATATIGSSFSYTITGSNSPTSFDATGLPAGLTVNTSTGLISGTPTASGTFAVTIKATNADGTGSQTLTLTVNTAVPPAPSISSGGSASATVGSTFNYSITASNNPSSYDATGLPAGLTVNTETGVISGTPTESGSFTVTIKAGNAGGEASTTFTLTVAPPIVTGLNPDQLNSAIEIYPNPLQYGEALTLKFLNEQSGTYQIQIYNAMAQSVLQTSIEVSDAKSAHTLNLHGLATGYYHLEMMSPTGIRTIQKIVVQ